VDDLRDKVAFITGGACGIGRALAEACVASGMNVVIGDMREDHIAAAMASFREQGLAHRVHAIALEVTDRAAMAAAADEAERVFGKVHVLVNNAGIGISGPFSGITYEDWDFGLGVNLGGVVNGLQTFLPRIRAHGEGGHVVNIASMQVLVPMSADFVIYRAAKMAVLGISECLSDELARQNIGMTVVIPGMTRTNIHDIRNTRPAKFSVGAAFAQAEDGRTPVEMPGIKQPPEIAAMILRGIRENRLYVISHGEWRPAAEALNAARLQATPAELDPELVDFVQARFASYIERQAT
jgi:NAD(P)-dependent dehydrogenase (short-subunit alcohol dehydrogenase family)